MCGLWIIVKERSYEATVLRKDQANALAIEDFVAIHSVLRHELSRYKARASLEEMIARWNEDMDIKR